MLEVMAAVAIVGVLLGMGMPALFDFVKGGRMTAAANDLLTAVMAGNAEAQKRRAPVTLCSSPDPNADAPKCNDGSGGWADGWVVFHDVDGDFEFDAGDDEVVLRHNPLSGTLYVVADDQVEDAVQFAASGRLFDVDGASLQADKSNLLICDDRGNVELTAGNSAARALRLAPTGRATLFRAKDFIDSLDVEC